MLVLFFLFFYFDTLCVVYNQALSNLRNLILKFLTSLIWLIYISFTNYSYYVAFDKALGLLDQLRKQQKRNLEKEQNSGSSLSKGFLKITVPETCRGILRLLFFVFNLFLDSLQISKETKLKTVKNGKRNSTFASNAI